MPRGYRWMFWLTGMPGWMRFGFSPGGKTLPPRTQYPIATSPVYPPGSISEISSDDEIKILRERAEALERELREIKKRLEELQKE
jgi:hypothetical protein